MDLEIKRCIFSLEFDDQIPPMRFAMNTLRGGFGYALKDVSCTFRNKDCERCVVHGQCVYSYVFDTVPDKNGDFMKKYNRAPHPFVLYSNESKENVKSMALELTLIGKAISYFPYFVLAIQELGKKGLGASHAQFCIESIVEQDTSRKLYDKQDKKLKSLNKPELFPVQISDDKVEKIQFTLESPLRLRYEKRILREPNFRAITGSLLRRISALCHFHGSGTPELNYKELAALGEKVIVIENITDWIEQPRYSTRQKDWMKLGGIMGEFTVKGNLGPFMYLLRLGEAVHLGKACTFGLGRYRIVY